VYSGVAGALVKGTAACGPACDKSHPNENAKYDR
jgi:hypothetical protein